MIAGSTAGGIVGTTVTAAGVLSSPGEEAEALVHERSTGAIGPMRSILHVLPPGDFRVEITGPTEWPEEDLAHMAVEMAFTDGATRHWVRRAWGSLRPLVSAPADHYAISRPLRYSTLEDRGSIEGV